MREYETRDFGVTCAADTESSKDNSNNYTGNFGLLFIFALTLYSRIILPFWSRFLIFGIVNEFCVRFVTIYRRKIASLRSGFTPTLNDAKFSLLITKILRGIVDRPKISPIWCGLATTLNHSKLRSYVGLYLGMLLLFWL
jgi:hypothetical protein